LVEGLDSEVLIHTGPNTTSSGHNSGGSNQPMPTQAVSLSGRQPNLNTAAKQKSGAVNSNNPVGSNNNGSNNPCSGNDPVLFLSVNLNRNQSIARTIKLRTDDKTTFQALRKEYQNLCAKWFRVKHVTGIKFYRVRFFHVI
jgi:hypothetical protein